MLFQILEILLIQKEIIQNQLLDIWKNDINCAEESRVKITVISLRNSDNITS